MLHKSAIIFNEIEHTYSINGKNLSGITSILGKYLFPNMYDNVPVEILEKARERGTLVHSQIQMSIEGFDIAEPTEEFLAYKNLNLDILESEYIVSNNTSVASAIDLVGSDYTLYDIKTTSTLNKEYVSWQLSIYAYLFELQNPELKVNKLCAIHLRGSEAKVVEVTRIADEHVLSLLTAFENSDEYFINPLKKLATTEEEMLQRASELEQSIINLELQVKEYKAKQDMVKESLMVLMDERGITKLETDNICITRKADSTRESVDSKALKEKFADVYNEVKKTTKVKGSIIIKLKQAV